MRPELKPEDQMTVEEFLAFTETRAIVAFDDIFRFTALAASQQPPR